MTGCLSRRTIEIFNYLTERERRWDTTLVSLRNITKKNKMVIFIESCWHEREAGISLRFVFTTETQYPVTSTWYNYQRDRYVFRDLLFFFKHGNFTEIFYDLHGDFCINKKVLKNYSPNTCT